MGAYLSTDLKYPTKCLTTLISLKINGNWVLLTLHKISVSLCMENFQQWSMISIPVLSCLQGLKEKYKRTISPMFSAFTDSCLGPYSSWYSRAFYSCHTVRTYGFGNVTEVCQQFLNLVTMEVKEKKKSGNNLHLQNYFWFCDWDSYTVSIVRSFFT